MAKKETVAKILRVDGVARSRTGGSFQVKCNDGKNYTANLKSGIEQALGRTIEAQTSTFDGDRGPVNTIEEFAYIEDRAEPAPTQVHVDKGPGAATATTPYVDRWWLAYVSNQCAHAILSGLIKTPQDLTDWARHAKSAIMSADTLQGGDVPFS